LKNALAYLNAGVVAINSKVVGLATEEIESEQKFRKNGQACSPEEVEPLRQLLPLVENQALPMSLAVYWRKNTFLGRVARFLSIKYTKMGEMPLTVYWRKNKVLGRVARFLLIKYTEMGENIPNHKIAIKFTNIFHCKTLQD
jgi:hypothetical protein